MSQTKWSLIDLQCFGVRRSFSCLLMYQPYQRPAKAWAFRRVRGWPSPAAMARRLAMRVSISATHSPHFALASWGERPGGIRNFSSHLTPYSLAYSARTSDGITFLAPKPLVLEPVNATINDAICTAFCILRQANRVFKQ